MKSILRSRVFWVNLAGMVVELLTNQTFLDLPFVSAFTKAHPSTGLYIAFVVFALNLAIRMETMEWRSLQVKE